MRASHKEFYQAIEALLIKLIINEDSEINKRLDKIERNQRKIMANQADLDTAIADLATAVNDLAGRIPAAVDLQPQVDAVNAVKTTVEGIAPPAP